MSLIINEFESTSVLNQQFGNTILSILSEAIETKGKASLVVSGGSTPKPLFQYLSSQAIAWEKVTVTLADDRWLDKHHADSNEKLVREHLLVNKAVAATFVSLTTKDAALGENAEASEAEISRRIDAIDEHFDILILGMGEDGHTASLFPCCAQIKAGLDLSRKLSAIATQPTTASYQRMSMTLAKIVKANNVFLHLTGEKKRQVLQSAIAEHSILEKPIKAVCENTDVTLMWAP